MHDDEGAIRDLVSMYCHAIAERDDAAWAATWAEDGEWVVLGSTVRGRGAILAHYQKLVSGVRWVIQHANNGIVEVDGSSGRGRWQIVEYLQGAHGGGGVNIARYRDDYVRGADGKWRFARRELHATHLGSADLSARDRKGERSAT